MTNAELRQHTERGLEDLDMRLREYNVMAERFHRRTEDGFGPGDEQFAHWLVQRGKELLAESEHEIAYAKLAFEETRESRSNA
jgi:hypothetical protein